MTKEPNGDGRPVEQNPDQCTTEATAVMPDSTDEEGPKHSLNQIATEASAVMPTYAEVLALNVLIRRGIEDAESQAEHGLADLGRDFLERYEHAEVSVKEYEYFNREYVDD